MIKNKNKVPTELTAQQKIKLEIINILCKGYIEEYSFSTFQEEVLDKSSDFNKIFKKLISMVE